MVQINFAQKQINAKIVYYGPGMSGKTTNLEVVHQRAPSNNRGELTSISTDGDRTLFFDYMPLDLGTIAGMKTCFQMYTVPGQVYYNSTRKLVLQGVDGVIFVADSSAKSMEQNLESLRNLEENLNEYGKSLATLPHVIQYNKRDLPDALPVQDLEAQLNLNGAQTFEACAATGEGVFPTLKGLAAAVLKNIQNECGGTGRTAFHSVAARPNVTSSGPQPRPANMPPAPQRAPQTASSRPQPTGAQASSPAPSGAPLKQTGFQPRTTALAQEPASAPAGQLMQNAAAPAPQAKPAQRPRPAATRPQAAPAPAPAKPAPAPAKQGKAAKAPAPAAQPKRRAAQQPSSAAAPKMNTSGPSTAKTAAFVIVAAAIGAVVAKFALDFI